MTLFLKTKNRIRLIGKAIKAEIKPNKAGTIIPATIQVRTPIVMFFVARKTIKLINKVTKLPKRIAKISVSINSYSPSF